MADPVSVAASIAGLVSLADVIFTRLIKYGKAVKNAEKELKELTKDVNLLGGSLDSLSRLARALDDDSFNSNCRMDYVDDCSETLLDMERKLSKVEADSAKGRLLWPGRSSRLKAWREEISRHQGMISTALSADTLQALLQILSHEDRQTEEILSEIRDTKRIVSRVDKESRDSKVQGFFLKCNPQGSYEMSRQLRHPRTGLWLTNRLPQFQRWLATSKSALWLRGMPGAGKTVLAGSIIEAAWSKTSRTDSMATAFFFCDYKDPITQSPETILGVLAYQLSTGNDDASKVLAQYYDELHPKRGLPRSPDVTSLKVLLHSILRMYDHVYLVLDGLDECGNMTEDVIDVLIDIFDEADNTSVALLSRDEDNIRDRLSDCCVSIEVAAHKDDIMEYVTAQIQERIRVGKLSAYDPELKAEIIQGLVDGAKGMFRWVSCQLDHLKDCVSDQDCRDALLALPPTLDETYARILRRVPRSKRRLVQLALQFIAYASPKLTIRQLREALSVPDRHTLLEPRQIIHLNAITKYCSSLVRESSDGLYLEFSHFSVQEFLKTPLSEDPDLVAFCISESLSHRLLAVECLRFLQLRNFYRLRFDPETEGKEIGDREENFPFYSYAAEHWPRYARHAWDDAQVLHLAKELFHPNKSPYFTSWSIALAAEVGDIDIDIATTNFASPSFTPLHMAAALSLEKICSFLVEQSADVNMKSEAGCPLQCAVQGLLFISDNPDYPCSYLTEISGEYHGTLASEKTIKCLCGAGASLDTTSTQIYPGESLLQVAFRSALLNGGLSVPTVLIRLGISIRDNDLERASEMFQKFNDQSNDKPEEKYTTSLKPFIESLDKRLDKPPAALRLCSLAWEAALHAKLEFTFDVMAIDTRVTLSLGELEKQAIAAIKAFNPQALQKIMSDPRFQAPKVSDDDGNTLLHLTLMKFGYNIEKALDIAKVLLNAGCNILRPNHDGQEPLHVLDEHHTEEEEVEWPEDSDLLALKELMEMITESSATCASRDARGKTALHYHVISSIHLQAVLDAQPTENIMTALETVDKDGFTPLALSLKQGFLTSASILTKTLSMTPPAMASPIPILSLAVNANATEILELLIPLAYNSDFEPNESPLHYVGPGATAKNIRRLKSLYPDACVSRLHGETPFEAYLKRCLEKDPTIEVDNDVMDELSVLGSPGIDNSTHPKVWQQFAETAKDRDDEKIVTSAGLSLLRLGYMKVFEEETGISGILPMLSSDVRLRTNFDLHPIPSELICEVLYQTKQKTKLQEHPHMHHLLLAAAKSLDFELTTLLLNNGVSIHQRVDGRSILEKYCSSPPIAPAKTKANQMFDLLLEHSEKKELNECNPKANGLAAIHLLAQPGAEWMVEKLVQRGADPNLRVRNWTSNTALVHHLFSRRPQYATLLLSLGADPSIECFGNWDAPLASAATGHMLVLADILASDNAKSNPRVKWERTCVMHFIEGAKKGLSHDDANGLHAGANHGSSEIINFYLDNCLIRNIDAKTSQGWTALHFAAHRGHSNVIKVLCGHGANVNVQCNTGRSPLHLAAEKSKLASARVLVDAGGKPFADFSGCKPSFYANPSDSQDLHEWLLSIEKEGTDSRPSKDMVGLDATSGFTLSTICAAAILENQIPKLELLATKAFDFESPLQICEGCSGLIYAIKLGRLNIIQWLLEQGASIARSVYCVPRAETGLHLVLKNPALELIIPECLINFTTNGGNFPGHSNSLIDAAVAGNNLVGLKHLLTKGIPDSRRTQNLLSAVLSETDNRGNTPLISAVQRENLAAIELLLNFGANVDEAAEFKSNTPLHEAAAIGNAKVVSFLIENGSNLELRNQYGQTPLLVAAQKNKPVALRALLGANVDQTALDHDYWSFLDHIDLCPKGTCSIFADALRAGVDPHKPVPGGVSAFHRAVCQPHFTSYVLNSSFSLDDSMPFCWRVGTDQSAWVARSYQLFRRKYPKTLKTFANLMPSNCWSPLCQFASRGKVECMKNLLDLNCSLDHEGCPLGSALMVACANGRMTSVTFLIRSGASLTYHGLSGYRSAYIAAGNQRAILSWLLVGRFVDQDKLTGQCGSSDTRKECQLFTWGGPMKAEVVISGELERRPKESSQAYWSRLQEEKLNWRGKVPPLAGERRTIRPSNLIPVEKIRAHPDDYNTPRALQLHNNGDSNQDDKRDMRFETVPKMVFDNLL